MKIKRSQLKQIIKEEIKRVLNEQDNEPRPLVPPVPTANDERIPASEVLRLLQTVRRIPSLSQPHVVQQGDTITDLAATWGVSPQTLTDINRYYNPDFNPDVIIAGREIRRPGTELPPQDELFRAEMDYEFEQLARERAREAGEELGWQTQFIPQRVTGNTQRQHADTRGLEAGWHALSTARETLANTLGYDHPLQIPGPERRYEEPEIPPEWEAEEAARRLVTGPTGQEMPFWSTARDIAQAEADTIDLGTTQIQAGEDDED